jgi:hypothetical protein
MNGKDRGEGTQKEKKLVQEKLTLQSTLLSEGSFKEVLRVFTLVDFFNQD